MDFNPGRKELEKDTGGTKKKKKIEGKEAKIKRSQKPSG